MLVFKSGFVEVLGIAKPRLPLTRELSSEARLRERKAKVYIYLYSFSPSVNLTVATSLVRGRLLNYPIL